MLQSLWVMRHGLAVDNFTSDFSRDLSEIGKLQVIDVATQIKQNSNKLPLKMLVSPFKRTQETAKTFHQQLKMEQSFETEEMLVHFADHKILGDYLLACDEQELMIVSHMPIVALLCQYLVPNITIYGFQPAQLVRIDFKWNDFNKDGVSVANGKLIENYIPRLA